MQRAVRYITIGQYASKLGVSKRRASDLIKRLDPIYIIRWDDGRVTNIRSDAPDVRKKNGRPKNG